MSAIWKYELQTTQEQEFIVPGGGKVLCVQVQNETPCVWMLVEPEAKTKPHRIHLYPTGMSFVSTGLTYIGTVQLLRGQLVFHIFDGH